MLIQFLDKIFNANQRKLNQLKPILAQINALEPQMQQLDHQDFAKKTRAWQKKLRAEADPATRQTELAQILPEAFALVREACRRMLGERTFDEQLMVAVLLHQGKAAEQKTGEGKTHAAVHPLYLNSLTGRGAHLVTVNDYLARRDAEWMGPVYSLLGVSVGVINSNGESYLYEPPAENPKLKATAFGKGQFLKKVSRKQAYQADVLYGTNNEFGFDYLRDNMVRSLNEMVQTNPIGEFGAHHFVIVDEVDSILIDEARTPLIISAPAEESNELYQRFAKLVKRLNPEDYELDEKAKTAFLTDLGVKKIEHWMQVKNIYEDFTLAHHLEQALKAEYMYHRDTDYVVKDNEVIIVDEFTGRLMEGRRYSEGLHQAIEAKEGVTIQKESKTVATITFQNYFRLYEKLSGMSATIITEAEEFDKIYQLDSVSVPTHKPVIRQDHPDRVYKHQRAKWKAIADEIASIHKTGQPILVGTTSVEKNELVSQLLNRRKIRHEILNAKNHAREAEIIAKAGKKGAVTVATNMAGRGTDIKLGPGVKELGGLHVIGTERHEARRIDNQLRGRSGRQGDPGSSRFFVALDDDLMRIFGGERIANLMTRFDLPEDLPIESGIVSKAIENAQKKVEGHNFDIRKHLVEYDDVINKQREIIYTRRRQLLEKKRGWKDLLLNKVKEHTHNEAKFKKDLTRKEALLGQEQLEQLIREIMLGTLDHLWMEHIDALDELRSGVGLRAYGQRDPLVEFKNEAFRMFEHLVKEIDLETINRFNRIQIAQPSSIRIQTESENVLQQAQTQHHRMNQFTSLSPSPNSPKNAPASLTNRPSAEQRTYHKSPHENLGRNEPCWCGSGKKFKHCHGK